MSGIRHSRRLRKQFEWMIPEASAATGAIVTHPQFRELYPEFLITLHQLIRATVPVMEASLRRCRELAGNDLVAASMVEYYEHHIKEELHHDDWVLEDLEYIGVPREEVLRRMPPPTVASFIGAQYYWIYHHHPVAQLGQIAVQEGYPPSETLIELMVDRSGYDRRAFRTLEKHGHLDPNHRDDFDDALDRMPLRDEHHEILRTSAIHTVRMAARAYRAVLRRSTIPERRPDLVVERVGPKEHFHVTDPLCGTVFRIGPEEKFLLDRCDGRTEPAVVCKEYHDSFRRELSPSDLAEFLDLARGEAWLAEDDA